MRSVLAIVVVPLAFGCAPTHAKKLDIDVVLDADAVRVFPHDPEVTCDCSDGTFPTPGVCITLSDTTECHCPTEHESVVARAPCIDLVELTGPSLAAPQKAKAGAIAPRFDSFSNGIDPTSDDLSLHIAGCGDDVEVPLPKMIAHAPHVRSATQVGDDVHIELDEPHPRIEGACGIDPSTTIVVGPPPANAFFFPFEIVLTDLGRAPSAYGPIHFWAAFRSFEFVVAATKNADGSFTLPFEEASLSFGDAAGHTSNAHLLIDSALQRENGDLDIEAHVDPDRATQSSELTVTRVHVVIGAHDDTIELYVGGKLFTSTTPHRDRSGNVDEAEALVLEFAEPRTFTANDGDTIASSGFEFDVFNDNVVVSALR